MTDTFRALCAELANYLQGRKELECGWGEEDPEQDLLDRARTALAQPEPEGPTDDELEKLADRYMITDGATGVVHLEHIDYARAVLAHFGRPAIKPVPVSERPWERKGWCDAEGRCYGWDGDYWWMIGNPEAADETITHWLPHHALPVPAPSSSEEN